MILHTIEQDEIIRKHFIAEHGKLRLSVFIIILFMIHLVRKQLLSLILYLRLYLSNSN
jgi:uncharacterized membrane protein YciS (DUF1049 family)